MELQYLVETSTGWLVAAIILMAISLITMFIPKIPACIIAYMAFWAARLSNYTPFSDSTMIFWGIAVLIVTINRYLLPSYIRFSRRGLGYIGGGALVGMALGLTLYRPASVIGNSIIGAILGAIAYSRTARGKALEFPTSKFFSYLGAKGIPAVVVASMVGLILAGLIARNVLIP